MSWSSTQKQLAVRACKAAGMSEDQRRMILSGPAFGGRAVHLGRVTSTAPTLTNGDYECFMSFIEKYAGGQILHFSPTYWQTKAGDPLARLRWKVRDLARILEAASDEFGQPLLSGEKGLKGWILAKVTRGEHDDLDKLTGGQLTMLIEGLKAYAQRHSVETEDPMKFPEPAGASDDSTPF